MKYNRAGFIREGIRVLIAMILGLIGIALGRSAVSGSDCTGCSGIGICNGKTDCNKFLVKGQ